MTWEQAQIIEWLSTCRFLPASFDKRFVSDMNTRRQSGKEYKLSEKQNIKLLELLHKYRNQIGIEKHKKFCEVCNHA